MTMLPVPSESDWENYKDDIDASYAHDLFIGKTNDEMRVHFERTVIERTNELRFMPKLPFRYYMLGFKDYVLSISIPDERNLDAADAASCFIRLVEEKLNKHSDDIWPIMPDLIPAVDYVAKHQRKFGADEDIYGNFYEKTERIKAIFENHNNRYKK